MGLTKEATRRMGRLTEAKSKEGWTGRTHRRNELQSQQRITDSRNGEASALVTLPLVFTLRRA